MTQPHADERQAGHDAISTPRTRSVPIVIGLFLIALLALGAGLQVRASSRTNQVALVATPKSVSVVQARAAQYRPSVHYVGSVVPWIEARLGPQFTSAYVDTVLVRPGASVRRNQVLATLDCRNASAQSRAVAMQARALETQQAAIAHQAARVGGLLDGGYVSPDEAEQKSAESVSKQAELLAAQARLLRASLEVDDCILRAPFDGEVAERSMDPGAFARPGNAILSVIDRSLVRVSADAPEGDFGAVGEGTPVAIHLLANNARLAGTIARRSPAADPATRTVHFEIDLRDPERAIPVNTTAELSIEVGAALPATEVPLIAANVRGSKANLYVVEAGRAKKHSVAVLGEAEGRLFLEPALAAGSEVVTEGRTQLQDGDRVEATLQAMELHPQRAEAVPAVPAPATLPAKAPAPRERATRDR